MEFRAILKTAYQKIKNTKEEEGHHREGLTTLVMSGWI
jgi:hypothetical protein